MELVEGGSICIRLNDENNPCFKPRKGRRQENLSPLYFSSTIGKRRRSVDLNKNVGSDILQWSKSVRIW
jgi:hypothetical protein